MLALSLAGSLLLALAGWHVWRERTAYARRVLEHFLPGFAPGLDALDLSATEIKVNGLLLHDPETGEVLGSVREARLDPWWDGVRQRRIGHLRIDGLRVRTSAARLPHLLSALPFVTAAPEPKPAAGPPLSIASVELSDMQFEFAGDQHLPSVSFRLDHGLENFRMDGGVPTLTDSVIQLHDLQITTPDGSRLVLPSLRLRASFDPKDGLLNVRDLVLTEAAIDLLPALLDWVRSLRSSENPAPAPLPAWFKGVVIHQSVLQNLALRAAKGLPGAPGVALETRLRHEMTGLHWQAGAGLQQAGSHRIELSKTQARPAAVGTPGHLLLPELRLALAQADSTQPWEIDELTATGLDLHWTPQWEAGLLSTQGKTTPEPPAPKPAPAALHLRRFVIKDSRVDIDKTDRAPLDLKTRIDGELADLRLLGSQLKSAAPQNLRLHAIEMQIPGSRTAAPTRIDAIELSLRPDALIQEGLVDRLRIASPRLEYHLDFAALKNQAKGSGDVTSPASTPAALPNFLQRLHFTDLAVTAGSLRVRGRFGAPFETETTFELRTEPSQDPASSLHHLAIAGTRLVATEHAPLPVASVGRFEARARLPELLTEHRLESLLLDGGQVEFGDALLAVLDPGTRPQSSSTEVPAPASPKKPWSAGHVQVRDLSVTLQRVAPGLPPFSFSTQFEAHDSPLQPEGLVAHVEPQKVELSSLMIPSPYGLSRPVARLDTIFVHFTLDGLLRRRISKVEILNPTLYVGQPLFWYVDYYRKYAAGDIKTDADAPDMTLAAAEKDTALNAAAAAVSGPPRQAWIVEELEVHSGKLVLAPKGVPLPGFRQPFPFSFATKLESGQFEAVLDIPADNYPLPQLKLELIGMKGQVHFNLPMKNVDNNLTETFTVDQIRWKQLHAENGHLSVTYDMNGIYGKFGSEAYDGYIEGGFDVYLNDSYTWDGWIAASSVRATEVTQKLTPAYLLLDGQFNGSLIAAGDSKELYQADLDFTSTGAGNFAISGLDDMLDKLPPPNVAALTSQFTRIGLETLRDFDYDLVHAKGRLHGREGSGFLKISGPLGSRNIEVNVLDHRWKVDKPEETESGGL